MASPAHPLQAPSYEGGPLLLCFADKFIMHNYPIEIIAFPDKVDQRGTKRLSSGSNTFTQMRPLASLQMRY